MTDSKQVKSTLIEEEIKAAFGTEDAVEVETGWGIGTCDNGLHLVPINDLKEHLDSDCPCHPIHDDNLGVWAHNSFDGREAFETSERKPS